MIIIQITNDHMTRIVLITRPWKNKVTVYWSAILTTKVRVRTIAITWVPFAGNQDIWRLGSRFITPARRDGSNSRNVANMGGKRSQDVAT